MSDPAASPRRFGTFPVNFRSQLENFLNGLSVKSIFFFLFWQFNQISKLAFPRICLGIEKTLSVSESVCVLVALRSALEPNTLIGSNHSNSKCVRAECDVKINILRRPRITVGCHYTKSGVILHLSEKFFHSQVNVKNDCHPDHSMHF